MVHFKNPFKNVAKDSRDPAEQMAALTVQDSEARHFKTDEVIFADWERRQMLGKGGFGHVQQIHRRGSADNMDLALKVIPLDQLMAQTGWSVSEIAERYEEFRILLGSIGHPNCIRGIDWQMSRSYLYLWIELCSGGDLFDRIVDAPQSRIPEEEVKGLARGLCRAVAFAHERGWIHRDIKPENVLFRTPSSKLNQCVLADWGCALHARSDILYTDHAGSLGYTSPEMVAGTGYTFTTDEFSMGCLIYSALTGRSPFVSDGEEDLRQEVINRKIPYPPRYWKNLSPLAKHFVQGLLDKNPRNRMTVEEGLEHPWLAVDSPEAIDIPRSTSPEPDDDDDSDSGQSTPAHHATSMIVRHTKVGTAKLAEELAPSVRTFTAANVYVGDVLRAVPEER